MEKVDANTIAVEIEITGKKSTATFERGYLERQKAGIQLQRDTYCAARDRELDEVNGYLAQCDALGIVAKPDPLVP